MYDNYCHTNELITITFTDSNGNKRTTEVCPKCKDHVQSDNTRYNCKNYIWEDYHAETDLDDMGDCYVFETFQIKTIVGQCCCWSEEHGKGWD